MTLNHNLLFAFGMCFYIFFPILLLEYIEVSAFSMIPRLNLYSFLWVCLFSAFTVFFWFVGQRWKVKYFRFDRKLTAVHSLRSTWFIFVVSVLVFLYGLMKFGVRGGGYSEIDFKYSGFLAGFSYLFMALLLFSSKTNWLKRIAAIFYVVCCVLLLMVGSRLYVLSTLIALTVFYSSFAFNKLQAKTYFIIGVVIIFLLVVGGLRSVSASGLSLDKLLFVVGAEPFFTWWSVSLYHFDFIELMLPEVLGLMSLLINLVPSFLLPNKSEYIIPQSVLGGYEAPLGASNVIVGALTYFGLPMWCLVILIFSSFVSFLKRYSLDFFMARYLYSVACSFIPFLFFREIYQIQFKLFFTFMFIIPFFIVSLRCILHGTKKI